MFDRLRPWLAFTARHERSLSALAMVAGFASDNYFFRRIDLPNTQVLFIAYLLAAAGSIALRHYFEARRPEPAEGAPPTPRWRALLPVATQFALGSLWSGFLIFFTRSAVIAASWPFLLLLAVIFIGNEVFRKYLSQLAFTGILLFFALLAYAIATVPIVTRHIGMYTFLFSGGLALGIFALYLYLLRILGREKYASARWRIMGGAICVYGAVTLFYFTGILPPLPLALSDSGIYHFVKREGANYVAIAEPEPWTTAFGVPAILHIAPGQPLYCYTAVFAPAGLTARILHRWQHYDETRKRWVTLSEVPFSIRGGRDGGYRAYSIKRDPEPGEWRVEIDTADGRVIGRVRFRAVRATAPLRLPLRPIRSSGTG